MTDVPDPWGQYTPLQRQLSASTFETELTMGIESGLDAIIEGIAAGAPLSPADVSKRIESARRRERYRAARRHVLAGAGSSPLTDPEAAACVADDIGRVRAHVTPDEWILLWRVAEGYSYAELALQRHSTDGALRVRAKRIRDAVARQLGAAS